MADLIGMSNEEHKQWYRIAEGVPLTGKHAKHILDKLKEDAA